MAGAEANRAAVAASARPIFRMVSLPLVDFLLIKPGRPINGVKYPGREEKGSSRARIGFPIWISPAPDSWMTDSQHLTNDPEILALLDFQAVPRRCKKEGG